MFSINDSELEGSLLRVDETGKVDALDLIELDRANLLSQRVIIIDPGSVKAQLSKSRVLDDSLVRIIAMNLGYGATKEVAARAAGVSVDTFRFWMTKGIKTRDLVEAGTAITPHQRDCLYLVEVLEIVESGAELSLLNMVLSDGAKGAKWLLARRYPDRYTLRHAPKEVHHDHIVNLQWPEVARPKIEAKVDPEGAGVQDQGVSEGVESAKSFHEGVPSVVLEGEFVDGEEEDW